MGEALSDNPLFKVAWFIVLLLGLLLLGLHILVKASEKEVTFEKVQEEKYDKFIVDLAFGTVVKDGEECVYPKVIVFEDEVEFLDEEGQTISRESLVGERPTEAGRRSDKTAILSLRGNFVAVHHYTREWGDDESYIVEEKYTIYDDRGKEICSIPSSPEGTGDQDELLVSDRDGSLVRARIEFGAIDFYHANGEVRTIPIFDEPQWRRRMGYLTISRDGEYVALLIREIKSPPGKIEFFDADIWAILLDRSGRELWRRKLDQRQLGGIAVSDNGRYVVFKAYSFEGKRPPLRGEPRVAGDETISLCDKQGDTLNLAGTGLCTYEQFTFSPEATYVAVACDNIVRLVRIIDRNLEFERSLVESGPIRQLLFSNDGEYLIVKTEIRIGSEKIGEGYRSIYNSPISVFNMKGDLIWRNDFTPRLRGIFSENGFLAFYSLYGYEIYREIRKDK